MSDTQAQAQETNLSLNWKPLWAIRGPCAKGCLKSVNRASDRGLLLQAGLMHWVLEPSHLAQRQVALPAELSAAGCSAVRWGEDGRVVVGDPAGRIWTLQVVFLC